MNMFRISLAILCLLCVSLLADAQADDTLILRIDSLRSRIHYLGELQDSVNIAIEDANALLRELEFDRLLLENPDGYEAIVTNDTCLLAMNIMDPPLQKGSRVLVVGATYNGLWKVKYLGEEGLANEHCLKFRDRKVDGGILMEGYMSEAAAKHAEVMRLRDSIAMVEKTKQDSIEAVAQARLVEMAEAERDRLDEIGRSKYPFRIHDVWVAETNTAGGITMGAQVQYLKTSKRIKYLYLTFTPHNSVGDKVACGIRRTSEFIGKVTGPLEAQYEPYYWFWENAWYNAAITCIKVTKVKVEYTDGSTYTYVRELPKILGEFNNICTY